MSDGAPRPVSAERYASRVCVAQRYAGSSQCTSDRRRIAPLPMRTRSPRRAVGGIGLSALRGLGPPHHSNSGHLTHTALPDLRCLVMGSATSTPALPARPPAVRAAAPHQRRPRLILPADAAAARAAAGGRRVPRIVAGINSSCSRWRSLPVAAAALPDRRRAHHGRSRHRPGPHLVRSPT